MKTPGFQNGRIWGVLLLSLCAVAVAWADDYTVTTNSGKIAITKYTGPGGEVDIPGTINGLPVTSLGSKAFYTNAALTRVSIPDGVTVIGQQAFYGCQNLTNAVIGAGVTSFGTSAFFGCSRLPEVAIPDGVTFVANSLFSQCTRLTNATLGSGVLRIGNDAFEACTNLIRVNLPAGVLRIGDDAFRDCRSLAGIEIPGAVTNIGDSAFMYCSSLSTVAIPGSVTFIGDNAFTHCNQLEGIAVAATNPGYSSLDGVLFDKGKTALIHCPGLFPGSYAVPASVTNLLEFSFAGCSRLVGVSIPAGVRGIAEGAFLGCTGLVAIAVDDGNPVYEDWDGVLFDKSRTTLLHCPGATATYVVPSGVTGIVRSAFWRCDRLTSIGVAAGNAAFASSDGVLFNADLTTLVQFPPGRAGSYSIPAGVTTIGAAAFVGSYSLAGIAMPASVTRLENDAFSACTSLTNVLVGSGVTNIGAEAFFGCTNLACITFPPQVREFGGTAFYACTRLAGAYFLGNEPESGAFMFLGADEAVVYRLPEATGWGNEFGGRPTALWLPEAMEGDDFGVQAGRFGFTIGWAAGKTVVVEANADLATANWVRVGTNALEDGTSTFADAGWTNHPGRFYRLRELR